MTDIVEKLRGPNPVSWLPEAIQEIERLRAENAKLRAENKRLRSAMEELLWYTWQLERDVCDTAKNAAEAIATRAARAALGGDK